MSLKKIYGLHCIIAILFFQFIPTYTLAQQNPLGNIIGGIIGAAQSQQASAEWQKISPLLQMCFNTGLQRNRTNINALIQNGIGPHDQRLAQLKQGCEVFTNKTLRQNYPCNFTTQNGQQVSTQCNESYALQMQNGNLQPITVEQAIVESFNNRKVVIDQFERPDALTQRQNQQAEQARQAQIQAQKEREQQAEQARQAKIQAQKEREQAELQRKRAEEEKQRIAEINERTRKNKISANANALQANRKECKAKIEQAGFISEYFNKSSAIKTIDDHNYKLSKAYAEIIPFAQNPKNDDAIASMFKRSVYEVLVWRYDANKFDKNEFFQSIQILNENCFFEVVDYLAAKTAKIYKTEIMALLEIENSQNADKAAIEILKISNPEILQTAINDGEKFAFSAKYSTEEVKQETENKELNELKKKTIQNFASSNTGGTQLSNNIYKFMEAIKPLYGSCLDGKLGTDISRSFGEVDNSTLNDVFAFACSMKVDEKGTSLVFTNTTALKFIRDSIEKRESNVEEIENGRFRTLYTDYTTVTYDMGLLKNIGYNPDTEICVQKKYNNNQKSKNFDSARYNTSASFLCVNDNKIITYHYYQNGIVSSEFNAISKDTNGTKYPCLVIKDLDIKETYCEGMFSIMRQEYVKSGAVNNLSVNEIKEKEIKKTGSELVCNGYSSSNQNLQSIKVNCSDRKAVIDALNSAWAMLRKEQISGSTEDLCYSPYKRAKELHPSISFENIAPTFFAQCNMALKYVK